MKLFYLFYSPRSTEQAAMVHSMMTNLEGLAWKSPFSLGKAWSNPNVSMVQCSPSLVHWNIFTQVKLLYAEEKNITPNVTCFLPLGRIMQLEGWKFPNVPTFPTCRRSRTLSTDSSGKWMKNRCRLCNRHPGHRKLLLCSFHRLSNVDVKRSKMPHLAKTALITKLPSTWKPWKPWKPRDFPTAFCTVGWVEGYWMLLSQD